jgi:hypothetical protein
MPEIMFITDDIRLRALPYVYSSIGGGVPESVVKKKKHGLLQPIAVLTTIKSWEQVAKTELLSI